MHHVNNRNSILSNKFVFISLTNFTELNRSWEAANFTATQEFPNILWNPKVHYHVHKNLPMIPILSQIYPVHTTPSYLSKIRFIIVQLPISWSS
jgi:hypothetical protein